MLAQAVAAFFAGLIALVGGWFGAGQVPVESQTASSTAPKTEITPAPAIEAPLANNTVSTPIAGSAPDTTLTGHTVDFRALPLGDGKYVTSAPKKGYVYLCNVMQGGQGAQENGAWIQGNTWDSTTKINVQGNVSWPNASVRISVSGDTRTIVTNDLPVGSSTGIFPIAASDPAHQYDGNPNSVEAQSLSFSLPANPALTASPTCIYGEVGVMTNGVLLLDAFDAEYRDAGAHEIQDSCDGHPHEGGVYHYHSLSSCIPNPASTNIIGWAFDGFPITGPELPDGKYITSADLDECHGMTGEISEDGKMVNTYHYVMTYDFPYSVSCFKGKSYEPHPGGQNTQSAAQGAGSAPQGGQPPQAALSACAGHGSGTSCSFTTPNGQISGTCKTPPNQSSLACVPG